MGFRLPAAALTLLGLALPGFDFPGLASPALAQPAAAAPLAQPAALDGERLLRGRCGACHGIDAGQKRPGPHLAGVLGRQAGTLDGVDYSPALKASGIVWDEESLDAYMAEPAELVPGTSMKLVLRDPAQRQAIVEALRRHR